jgi:hypothetical protein
MVIVQEQTTQAVSNSSAMALALLCAIFVDICRRGDQDMARAQKVKEEKRKVVFELDQAKIGYSRVEAMVYYSCPNDGKIQS